MRYRVANPDQAQIRVPHPRIICAALCLTLLGCRPQLLGTGRGNALADPLTSVTPSPTPAAPPGNLPYAPRWVDSSGNIFVADSTNQLIRKIDSSTGLISSVAGNGL